MNSLEIVGLVAIILISAFALVAIIISIPLFKMIMRLKKLAENANTALMPIVDNLNTTVMKLNEEISTINDLTASIGSIVEQLEKVIKLARVIITSPIIKIISTASGLMASIAKKTQKNDN